MARENPRTWGAPTGRALLPTAGCAQIVASGSPKRPAGGEQEIPRLETASWGSFHRSDPGGRVAGDYADRTPFPHQATIVDIQRLRRRGAQQRQSSGGERPAPTEEKT